MRNSSKFGILLFFVATTLAMGCASTPLQSEASTSGIRAAEEVGAANVPQAALHLQLAKEGLERAKSLNLKGDEEKAASMLTRAEADAELAVALSRGDAVEVEANEAMSRVRQLQHENQ